LSALEAKEHLRPSPEMEHVKSEMKIDHVVLPLTASTWVAIAPALVNATWLIDGLE
jgi:hypothetical protein